MIESAANAKFKRIQKLMKQVRQEAGKSKKKRRCLCRRGMENGA